MAIGQRVGSMKALKQSLQKGGSNSAWIKYIPKNGMMNVRFIQEPEEWVNYVEHYDQTIRKSYPCNGESSCPGCVSGERKSYRYLTNAVDTDNDRVIPLQLPKDLANRLVVKYEKWGTLIDRDIELTRQGEGLDTVYDLDPGLQDRKKIDKYQPLDLLKVLDDAFHDVFGGGVDTEDETPEVAQPVKMRKASKAAQVAHQTQMASEPEVEEDDDEDEVEVVAPKKAPAKAATRPAKKAAKAVVTTATDPVFVPEEEDEEDDDTPAVLVADEPDEEDDEDEGYTEEQLKALPLGALRAVARDFDVDVKGKSAIAIIAEIMSSGEDEGATPF